MKKIYSISLAASLLCCTITSFAGDEPAPVKKTSRSTDIRGVHHAVGGNGFTVELRAGKIFSWGKNNHGQLGNNSTTNSLTPVQEATGASNWVDINAGFGHTLALKADGSLWAWGQNDKGQLGLNTFTDVNVPTQVGTAHIWVSLGCGGTHSMAISADGTLWSWGNNANGQLGLGTPSGPIPQPVQVGSANTWICISAGFFHSAGVQADGTLFTWGLNNFGQLGLNSTTAQLGPVQVGNLHSWKSVECGQYHTMALKSNGTLFGFGKNNAGQLGNGNTANQLSPVQEITGSNLWRGMACGIADTNSSFSHTLGIKVNGTVFAWGSNQFGQLGNGTSSASPSPTPQQISTLVNCVNVECGWACSFARVSNGQLLAWGNNASGNLGNGNTTNLNTPTAVSVIPIAWSSVTGGGNFTLGLQSDGVLYSWGDNSIGQLGNGTISTSATLTPTPVGAVNSWTGFFTGNTHSLAVRSNGTLFAWGNNSNGQLGNNTTINANAPIQVGNATNWISASAGDNHSMGVSADGKLWGWGFNQLGQLGIGTTSDSHIPVQVGTDNDWVDVECSGNFTHLIKSNGTLWAMGDNSVGQLGDGTNSNRSVPTQIGSNTNWIAVSSGGGAHTIAIQSDGSMWAWGDNNFGNLGNGSSLPELAPVQIGVGSSWIDVSCGMDHNLARKPDGTIWGWGQNNNGELGDGTNTSHSVPTLISSQSDIVFMTCGFNHTGIIKGNRSLICMTGFNSTGQLGVGSVTSQNTFQCSVGVACVVASTPTINVTANPICPGASTTLSIAAGNLNNSIDWQWYSNATLTVSAGSGTSINVSPAVATTYFVRGEGGCGNGNVASASITINAATPAPPTISGLANICTSSTYVYVASAAGATSYLWTVPTGFTILTGQGTPSLSVSTPASPTSGSITCSATNSCGTSTASNFVVTVNVLAPPSPLLTGPTVVCLLTSAVYTASSTGASTYTWTVPTGLTIVMGQGTSMLTCTVGAGTLSGNLTCIASNSCGTSSPTTLLITKKPQNPAAIGGPVDLCLTTTATYFVGAIVGATSHTWSVTGGLVIASGQGTPSITVTVPTNFASGTVKVYGVNACGSLPATQLVVYGKSAPTTITGLSNLCALTSTTYTCSMVPNASSYLWAVPSDWTIVSGQGSTIISVTLPPNVFSVTYTGIVKVAGVSACGTSQYKTMSVSYCKSPTSIEQEGSEISIYPNPVADELGIMNYELGIGVVEIFNMLGERVLQATINQQLSTISVSELTKGIYFVRIMSEGKQVFTQRFVKE